LAGLGRKEFNSGDILLASEVQGYLQDQAVMVFDDATARGSAIPSPSEGMLTYNKDTDQLELYDGSAFGPVGSDSGLIHIETRTLTAVASESFNNVFSSTYDNYRIMLYLDSSAIDAFRLRLRASGSDATTSNYIYQDFFASATSLGASRVTTTSQRLGSINASLTTSYKIDLFAPFLVKTTAIQATALEASGSATITSSFCNFNLTNSFDGFTVFPGSGNITGQISIYGYAKA